MNGNDDYQKDYPVTKERYDQTKVEFMSTPQFVRGNEEAQRSMLDEFFTTTTIPYLQAQGQTPEAAEQLRGSFIDKYMSRGLKKKDAGQVSLQSAEEEEKTEVEFPEYDLPDMPLPIYQVAQDKIQSPVSQKDFQLREQAAEAQVALQERADVAVAEVLKNDEFKYIQDNPGGFLAIYNTGEKDRLARSLKKQGYETSEIKAILPKIEQYAESQLIKDELGDVPREQLMERATKAAEPFIEGWKEGTFFDPETGMHREPASADEQDKVAFMEEFFGASIAQPPEDPEVAAITQLIADLELQGADLKEKYKAMEDYVATQDQAGAEFMMGYWDTADRWKKVQLDYLQKYRDVEGQIADYNKKIDETAKQEPTEKPEEKIDQEKANDAMVDAYVKLAYWNNMYDNAKAAMEGKTGVTPISQKAFYERLRKKRMAEAEFQAASLMAVKGLGPKDITRKGDTIDKYYLEIFGNAACRSFVGDKNMLFTAQPIDMEILRKMSEVGQKSIGLTEEEMKHAAPEFQEKFWEGVGSVAPDLPLLVMMGSGTTMLKSMKIIERALKGYKILRNPVLKTGVKTAVKSKGWVSRVAADVAGGTSEYGRAMGGVVPTGVDMGADVKRGYKALKIVVGFDDPVPVGWEVLKAVKPTRWSKGKAILGGVLIDEIVFTGLGGFAPGMISGMNMAHLATNKIKFRGKYGRILAPYLEAFLKTPLGGTLGMEAGALVAGAVEDLFAADKDLRDAWDAQWGNMSDAGKRVMAELALMALVFSPLHLYTTASAKKLSNPLGGGELSFIDPAFRKRVIETAKEADRIGMTETAEGLNRWLDLHNEPITGRQMKEGRIKELSLHAKLLGDEWLGGTLMDLENVIILLENAKGAKKWPTTVTWKQGGQDKELVVDNRFQLIGMLEDFYTQRGVLSAEMMSRKKSGKFKQPKLEGAEAKPPMMLPEGIPGEVFPDQTFVQGYDEARMKKIESMKGFENNRFGNPEKVLGTATIDLQSKWYEEWGKVNEKAVELQKKRADLEIEIQEKFKGRINWDQKKEREAMQLKIQDMVREEEVSMAQLENEYLQVQAAIGDEFTTRLKEKYPDLTEEQISDELATFQQAIGRGLPAEDAKMPISTFMDVWLAGEVDIKKPEDIDITEELGELEKITEEGPSEVARMKALLAERGREGVTKERLKEIDEELTALYYKEPGERVTEEEKRAAREKREAEEEAVKVEPTEKLEEIGEGDQLPVAPTKGEKPSTEGVKPTPPPPGKVEEYHRWVSEFSKDPEEIVNVHKQAMEEAGQKFAPWQEELLKMKVSRPSFVEWSKESDVDRIVGSNWIAPVNPRTGKHDPQKGLDIIAQELSELGIDVDENMIVEFINSHRSKSKAKGKSPLIKSLESRYKEITGKEISTFEEPGLVGEVPDNVSRILNDIGADITPEGLAAIREDKFTGFPYTQNEYELIRDYLEGTLTPGRSGRGGKIDVSPELTAIKDILGSMDFEYGATGSAGGGEHVQLGKLANSIVGKFVDAGIKDFPDIVSKVASKVEQSKMKKILPYLKQQAGIHGIGGAATFRTEDLEEVYRKLHEPKDTELHDDLIGKRIRVHPPEGVTSQPQDFEILYIEEWDKMDPGIQKYGGPLFAEDQPGQKVTIAVVSDLRQYGQGRKGFQVPVLRELLKSKKAEFLPDFTKNKERDLMIDWVADGYASVGDIEFAQRLRKTKGHAPLGITDENWKEQLQNYAKHLETLKQRYEVSTGRKLLPPYSYEKVSGDEVMQEIDRGKKKPATDFARTLDPELWNDAMIIHNELLRVNGLGGYSSFKEGHRQIDIYANNIKTSYPWHYLRSLGSAEMRVILKYKDARPDRVEYLHQLVRDAHLQAKSWPLMNAEFFTKQWIKNQVHQGGSPKSADVAGHLKNTYGFEISNSRIRELRELAYVEMARDIALQQNKSLDSRFNNLVSLYNSMPALTVKAADSKVLQEYSSPPPLAFLMGEYVNGTQVQYLIDITAGNGMLLINTMNETTFANEISPHRIDNLKRLPIRNIHVTTQDATKPLPTDEFPGNMDRQMMAYLSNPPFGSIDKVNIEDYFITKKEHLITMNGLGLMNDNGKAAIVMGGHLTLDPNGRIDGFEQYFYNWLYKNYNVEDIINIGGDLFTRMGTKWPTRLILINGRKPTPEGVAPSFGESVLVANTWTELYGFVENRLSEPNNKIIPKPVDLPVKGERKPTEETVDIVPPGPVDTSGGGEGGGLEPVGPPTGSTTPPPPPPPIGPVGGVPKAVSTPKEQRERAKKELSEREAGAVIDYRPRSKGPSGGTVLPSTMANEIEDALFQLEGEVGDVDDYVQGMLNYETRDDLFKAFYAEQIDGLAMSIFNMENGEAVIIGDQTGVGKGRIAAGVLRYARNKGYKPIFMTESANLYTDIYRDLIGISSGDLVPFIMNLSYEGTRVVITDPDGNELHKASEAEINRVIKDLQLKDEHDLMLITYSQIRSEKKTKAEEEKKTNTKRDLVRSLAMGNIIVMDESHNAAGDSQTGAFMQDIIENCHGAVFLSATYAKRPDNFPLYSIKSVVGEANMTNDQLMEAMVAGGVALQEIVSSEMVSAMQLLRRERDMTGVEVNYKIIGQDPDGTVNEKGKEILQKFDGVTSVMRDIVDFQRIYVKPYVKARTKKIRDEGKRLGIRKGTSEMGVYNHPYFSKAYNVIDQLLFSLKVNDVADMAIEQLKAGMKPFITFKSTMETQFEGLEFEPGETVKTDFSIVLERGLRGVMKVTVTDETGTTYPEVIDPGELGPHAQKVFYDLVDRIRKESMGVSAAPIDMLRRRIEAAGFKVLEITGRGIEFKLNEQGTEGTIHNRKRMPKNVALRHFNNEEGWAMLGNAAAATGLSAHAGHEFLDHSQRVNDNTQMDPNINVEMQRRGRINRAGQVVPPIYNNISTLVPAELRLMMISKKKLKSLDANTTSNQKQSSKVMDIEDFFDKYGDQVVLEYLEDNKELNNLIGDPLKLDDEKPNKENAAHRVSGKISILPTKQQEEFYTEVLDRYKTLMEYLEQTDQNDLVVKPMNLDAVTKDLYMVIAGRGGYSAFGDDSTLELMEVNALKKPMMKKEIMDLVNKELMEITGPAYQEKILNDMREGIEKAIETQTREVNDYYDQRVKELYEEYKAKEDEGMDPLDIERERADKLDYLENARDFRIDTARSNLKHIEYRLSGLVKYFTPGQVYEVPFEKNANTYTRMNKGVFLGFSINQNKLNPWIPSNFKMKFATSDSRRSFQVPASKKDYINSVMASNQMVSDQERGDFWNDWDKHAKGGDRRVHRWIVTGNILQAFSRYEGRLIEFTSRDGRIRKGILMPESFQPNEQNQVVISLKDTYNIIRALNEGDFIESTDGDIVIRKGIPPAKYGYWTEGGDQHYTLSVPDSRKRGAKYWDRDVSKLPDMMNKGEFEKLGDRMAGYFPEDRLREIIDYLDDKFKITLATRKDNVSRGSVNAAEANLNNISEHGAGDKVIDRGGLSHPANAMDMPSNSTGIGNSRVSIDPLSDDISAKKIWEIMFDAEISLGAKMKFQRPRSKKAAGTYSPGTGKISLLYQNNLDVSAHELGHFLDDTFGIVSPEYEHRFARLDTELRHFWSYGSEPPKGLPWEKAQQYRRSEGVAEWIRAWLVNPKYTEQHTPVFTEWFEDHVDEGTRKKMRAFGDDIRRYHAQSYIDKIGSQVSFAELEPKGFWSAFLNQFRRADVNSGNYKWTFGDRLIYNWFTSNHPWEKAFFQAAKMKGISKKQVRGYGKEALDPTQNAMMLGRLLAGHNDVIGRMLESGLIDPSFNVYRDKVTKSNLTVKFLFGSLDKTDLGTFRKDYWHAAKYSIAQRTISYAHTFQFDILKHDLEQMVVQMTSPIAPQVMIPSLEVLRKHPYLAEKFAREIQDALEWAADNGIPSEDLWHPQERYDTTGRTLTGIGGGEERDYDVATKAIAEVAENPERMKRYDEFLRRYELMADAIMLNMVKGGRMSQEVYDYIKARHLHYIALKRIMAVDPQEAITKESIVEGAGVGGDGLGKHWDPDWAKKITGSERGIKDPVVSLLDLINKTTYEINRNLFMQAYTGMLMPNREMYEENPQMLVDVATRVNHKINRYTEPVWRNGKLEWWEHNPLIYESLAEMQAHLPSDAITFMADVLRSSVVLAPVFAMKNFARDFQNEHIISPFGSRFKSLVGGREAKKLFQYAGGGQFGWYVKGNESYLQFMRQAMYELSGDKATLLLNPDVWKSEFWDKGYKRLLTKGEVKPRLIQFNNAFAHAEKHYPDWNTTQKMIFAAYHARNLLDFAVGGVVAKRLSRYMVFFNPRVKGWERYWQGWRDYPEKMWPQLLYFSIVPAALASYMISRMDEDTRLEYIKLPVWRRDLFYNIPMPEGSPIRWLSIPKPFEAGVIGSFFQRGFDYFLLDDKEAFSRYFFKDVKNSLMPFDENSFLSTFSGIMIGITKYDNFRQKYIVPPDELNKDIRLRNTQSASEFGKHLMEMSAWINKTWGPEHVAKPFIDPRVVDAIIQAQLSYYGRGFLKSYQSVFGDPQEDTYFSWDWSSTGWFRRQDAYGSIDVQWVLHKMRENELFWDDDYQDFNKTLHRMFEAPTPQMKRELGIQVLKKAERLREEWHGRDFVEEKKNKKEQPRKIGPSRTF